MRVWSMTPFHSGKDIVTAAVVQQGLAVDGGLLDVLLGVAHEEVILLGGRPVHFRVALDAVDVSLLHVGQRC